MKLECFLRMAKIKYEKTGKVDVSRHAPLGKVPFIDIDGKQIYDSGLIIDHLQQNGHNIDAELSDLQRADALALRRLLEEHLYWGIVYSRWVDPAGWPTWKNLLFSKMSFPLKNVAPKVALRSVNKQLIGQGLGRHTIEDIYKLTIADLNAVATKLGSHDFYFGTNAYSIDAAICATVGAILFTPWNFPLKEALKQHQNLLDHYARMISTYFPEYPSTAK